MDDSINTDDATAPTGNAICRRSGELKARCAWAEAVLTATHDGLWDWNVTTDQIYFSPSWAALLDEEDVTPAYVTWEDRIHPDDKVATLTSLQAHLAGETPSWQAEHRLRTRTGEWLWVLGRGEIIERDDDGRPIRMVGTTTDISRRRAAEEQVAKLARLPDENPNPVLRIGAEGVVLYANAASDELLGAWQCRRGNPLPAPWPETIKHVLADGKNLVTETSWADHTVSLTLSPMTDQGYVNIYGMDITEQKHLEEQFRHAQKMEAVGQLAGGIAHDFRNQLTVVRGYCDLLAKELAEQTPASEMLDEIHSAAERAIRVTAQLLAFSRRQALAPEPVDLNEMLIAMNNPLAKMIGEDIQFSVVPAAAYSQVEVDRSQLEQAIMNLAVNARDAMPDGGKLSLETDLIRLRAEEVRSRPDLPPGPYIMLTIRDSGEGMDARTRQRVFEPFFTTKDKGKGTGLGLSMVYGFVKQSNGHIELTSKPGVGTTFRLYLPWTSANTNDQADVRPADASHSGDETILVVEDEESVRQLVTRVLRREGYTVLESGNAREAMPLGEHYDGRVDLLISDVVMPEVSGPELAERLKLVRPDMPVLFISGYPDRPKVQESLATPNTHLLAKPFQPAELLETVRRMLDKAAEQKE